LKYLLTYWRKYRRVFTLGVVFVLAEALCELLQPRVMSVLIDDGAMKGSLSSVRRYALLMLVILAVGAFAALSRNYIASKVSQSFARDLRLDLFRKIQSLPADGIDEFDAGSLVTRMTNDVTQMQMFANGLMRMFVKAPFVCAGAVIMSATLNIRTIYIILPVIVMVFAAVFVSMKLAYPRFARMQSALDRLNATMREYLGGIRLVKAFRRFADEEKRFEVSNDALARETIGANNIIALFTPFFALFVNLGIAAVLMLGAVWSRAGDIQVGQIMAFVSYLAQMLGSLTMMSNMLNMFVRVKTSSERIAAVFAAEDERRGADFGAEDVSPSEFEFSSLRADNVSFRYKNSTGEPALCGLSFSLKKGETLGVIGPTGSGKTTLAALLMRFYEPTGGEITINGQKLSEIPEKTLRSIAAIVPQTPALFSGTIRDNLLWGKEDASDGEIRAAAKSADALKFIESAPGGFERVIGQGGVTLSGGQKQRVSIARALAKKPQLLILDDCTSALDTATEERVKQSIFDTGAATVFITQRISTVSRCDKILVLDDGRGAGFGVHETLLEECGVYRDIYELQIGGAANG